MQLLIRLVHALPLCMRQYVFLMACLSMILTLPACGKRAVYSSPGDTSSHPAPSGTFRPYTINGETYYPLDSAGDFTEEGLASWYGPNFHGKQTANGEVYNMYDLTAAHKVLPMNTMVRITNLENGKVVEVRINDRGPFVRDRIVDLSYTAAERIDIIGPGTGRVRLEVVGGGQEFRDGTIYGSFFVQIGSFTVKANADALLARMRQSGFPESRLQSIDIGGKRFWRVQVGSWPTLTKAEQAKQSMEGQFPSCFVIGD